MARRHADDVTMRNETHHDAPSDHITSSVSREGDHIMSASDHIMSARIADHIDRENARRARKTNSVVGSIDNILRFYYAATPEQVQRGYDWYADANAFAHALSAHTGITLTQAYDVIAANSINTPWDRNVTLAWYHATSRTYDRTIGTTCEMVRRIIENGERLRDIVGKDARKVRSFSANIEGDLNIATIDRWAFRIWVALADCECTGSSHGCGMVPNGAKYERIAADYAAAAAAVRVPVAVLQAITWIVLRGSAD
jgi:hypothetical protein